MSTVGARLCRKATIYRFGNLGAQNSHTENSSTIRLMPQKGSQDWNCSWSLVRFIKKNLKSARYLHIADPGSLRAMIRFGWVFHNLPPLIITIHGSELLRFTRFSLEKFLFRKLLKRSKKIHVLSKHNEDNLKDYALKYRPIS